MKRIALLLLLLLPFAAHAQEKGAWRATSNTALSITGDVLFTPDHITLNFYTFTIAEIRPLTSAEAATPFDGIDPGGAGHLYRLSIPGDKRFLHKNTMCGGDETQWLVTYVKGKELEMAFFSGTKLPVFTPEAMMTATTLCGIYAYTR